MLCLIWRGGYYYIISFTPEILNNDISYAVRSAILTMNNDFVLQMEGVPVRHLTHVIRKQALQDKWSQVFFQTFILVSQHGNMKAPILPDCFLRFIWQDYVSLT